MIADRIQSAARDITDLTGPEQQWSMPMDGDAAMVRRGVSGCRSIADLAAYLTPIEAGEAQA